jgi:hypothetical protein
MAQSLPSTKTVFVDIPEVKNFQADFHYNFFEPDEGVNDTGRASPDFIRKRPSESFDAEFIRSDKFNRFASRYIQFAWRPVFEFVRFKAKYPKIAKNLAKILTEGNFIAEDFTGIKLQDSGADNKIKFLVKNLTRENLRTQRAITVKENLVLGKSFTEGKALKAARGKSKTFTSSEKLKNVSRQIRIKSDSPQELSDYIVKRISKEIDPLLITNALNDFEDQGVLFRRPNGKPIKKKSLLQQLTKVKQSMQINNRFLFKTLETARGSSFSVFADEILRDEIEAIEEGAKGIDPKILSAGDYDFQIEEFIGFSYVDPDAYELKFKVLGYKIDKRELSRKGFVIKRHPPIILEDPYVSTTVDTEIKYGSRYKYNIRSIAIVEAFAYEIDEQGVSTGDLVVLRFLVSSGPSRSVTVNCTEKVPPPPPTDLSFRWDRGSDALFFTWSFPVNTQRDIKQWQVFRRRNINEPFELQQVFDFNDSVVKIPFAERPYSELVENLNGPQNFYYDYEFTKDSKFIYAVCSIDARGLTSRYSQQFECSFDKFQNRLKLKLISSSGAPKPYPNMLLKSDTFVDTIKDSGHKKLEIIFNPEYLKVVNNEGDNLRLLRKGRSSVYKISLINTDLQEQETINIKLLDKRRESNKTKDKRERESLLRSDGRIT